MQTNLDTLKEAFATTKCSLCHNYLSVPPILAISEDGTQYSCGRCSQVDCKTFMRVLCFENVAKYLTFPCTYPHCTQKIPWGEVSSHERTCPRKTLACPMFYQNCGETVQAAELWTHFTQFHYRNVRYDGITANLKLNEFVVYLLVVKRECFIVYICVNDREPSYVSVFSVVSGGDVVGYDLELSSTISGASVKYGKQKVVAYDERRHCLKCNERECRRKYHPYSMVYGRPGESEEVAVTNLKIQSIIEVLENPESLTFRIDVYSDK